MQETIGGLKGLNALLSRDYPSFERSVSARCNRSPVCPYKNALHIFEDYLYVINEVNNRCIDLAYSQCNSNEFLHKQSSFLKNFF